jgi:hypothetical protein
MGPSGDYHQGKNRWLWLLLFSGLLIYLPFIGGVHLFDWDEINFAEISREMITTGDYLRVQVDYKPFFEKPPLFFWIQSFSMHVFGINEFAARFPNTLCGLIVLVLLFRAGSKYLNTTFGSIWALSYLGSILPTLYHKSGIIDPWFNLFIFSSLLSWYEGLQKKNSGWFFFSGSLAGLAILTKGPVGPLIIGATLLITHIFSRKNQWLTLKSATIFLASMSFVAGLWFGIEYLLHGTIFINAFIKYQAELFSQSVAGHKGFPGYHFVVAFLGIFPASLFAINGFRKKQIWEEQPLWHFRLMMLILTAVVLILFSVVQSKIVHYSSLVYYPVTFLCAWWLTGYSTNRFHWKVWQTVTGLVVSGLILISLLILPWLGMNIEEFANSIALDDFTKSAIKADVKWSYATFIPAIWFAFVLIISFAFFRKRKLNLAVITLFGGTALLVNLFLIFFIGKIEHYSQRSAIEFYKSHEGKQVEIRTLGFHSYAPYFYSRKPVPDTTIARPHFYVVRADRRSLLEEHHELEVLYEQNGFIFLTKK